IGKHPVTPGAVLPVREQLGDLLLEKGLGAAALEQYERSLQATPNRFLGLWGAAVAADAAGDREKARAYYQKVVAVSTGGDALPDAGAGLGGHWRAGHLGRGASGRAKRGRGGGGRGRAGAGKRARHGRC